jgi:Zn-dependent peptidase ImmA (M78 family)
LEFGSEDEVLVFLVAHEAFHYLCRTRQVEGHHGEIEADAFALNMLEQYREGSSITALN